MDKSYKFDPVEDIRRITISKHNSGELGYITLTISVVYNFIFFDYPLGYGIYLLLPIIFLGTGYLARYWNLEEVQSQVLVYIGVVSIFLGLFIDLIVSASYIPQENGDYSLLSFPTLVLDTLGLVSHTIWFRTHFEDIQNINNEQEEEEEESTETDVEENLS